MAITNNIPWNQYTATADQTTFTYDFRIDLETDLDAYQTPDGNTPSDSSDILILNTDYTVTGAGTDGGGTIVLTTGAPVDDTITLVRKMPFVRSTQFQTGATFSYLDLDNELNSMILMSQELAMKIDLMNLNYDFTLQNIAGDRNLPQLTASQFWQKNSLNTGLIAADMEESTGWSTLRTELASQTSLAPGAGIIGYYDTIFGGTFLNATLNSRLPPMDDSIALVRNSVTKTNGVFLDASLITANRTITMPDGDITLGTIIKASNAEILAGTDDIKYFSTKGWHDNSKIILQRVSTFTGSLATGTTQITKDNSIPQNTEGNEYMTLAITPKRSDSTLRIEGVGYVSTSTATPGMFLITLFQDSTADALASGVQRSGINNEIVHVSLNHIMTSGTLSAITFKIRIGLDGGGTTYFNGSNGSALWGGTISSHIIITEYI